MAERKLHNIIRHNCSVVNYFTAVKFTQTQNGMRAYLTQRIDPYLPVPHNTTEKCHIHFISRFA